MAEDFQLELRGLSYAIRAWGPKDGHPLLAIHGWLDNALSFEVLAGHLPQYRIVAPDLAGHGLSGHRPPQGSYNIWDDLPDLLLLADALSWPKFSLLGHSRGAAIAALLAVAAPERVAALLLLEGFLPLSEPVENAPAQLAQCLRDTLVAPKKKAPSHPDRAAAAAGPVCSQRHEPGGGRNTSQARVREEEEGGCRWRSDPGLPVPRPSSWTGPQPCFPAGSAGTNLVLLAQDGLARMSELRQMCENCPKPCCLSCPAAIIFTWRKRRRKWPSNFGVS